MAGDIETRLKIAATEQVALAFRNVSQQVAQLEQNVTRSNRKIHESGQTVLGQMEELGTRGFSSINTLTGGFAGLGLKVAGVAAGIDGLIDSFTTFAKREEEVIRSSNATGESLERTEEAFKRAEAAAIKYGIALPEARKGADDLNIALGGIDKAAPQYDLLLKTTAALGTTTEETAAMIKSAVNDLKIPTQELGAFFDKIQKGAEGGALRSKGLAQSLAGVGQQASALYGGQVGPKAQGQLIGLAEAIAKSAPETEVPARIEEFLDISGGRKPEVLFKRATGIDLGFEAQQAAKRRRLDIAAGREGKDPIESFLDTIERGRQILHRRRPDIPIDQLTNRLFASPSMRRTVNDLLADRAGIAAARGRTAAEEAGSIDKAAGKIAADTAAKLRRGKGYIEKTIETVGGVLAHPLKTLEELPTQATPTPEAIKRPDLANKSAAPKRSWWDWFSQFSPISAAHAAQAPFGGFPAVQGPRALIPSESGSATERTAREQLEAIRRLERARMWGGWGFGGVAGGFQASEAMGSGGHGAERRAKFGHGGLASGQPREKPPGETPEEKGAPQTGEPGKYRPVYKLGPADLSDAVVNTIAGEARLSDQKSVDAVIDNMLNRVGTKGYGPSGNLKEVARAPGQYAGYRRATAAQAAYIRSRIKAIASGSEPDITHGANEYRAGWYTGPWARHHANAPIIGGNRFARNPNVAPGSFAPYDRPREAPPAVTARRPQHESELEEFRRKAAEPVRVKVAYDFDAADVRTHNRAYARRSFDKEVRDRRYASYSDLGTPT